MSDAVALERETSRLLQAGFAIADERGPDPEAFGDQLVVLTRGGIRVSLVRDRGQTYLTLAKISSPTGRDLGVWESCMDDETPSLETRDLEADVDLLLGRLPDFESFVIASRPETDACLREAGQWRFSQRRLLGLITYPAS